MKQIEVKLHCYGHKMIMKNREIVAASFLIILILFLMPCFVGAGTYSPDRSWPPSRSSIVTISYQEELLTEELMLPAKFEDGSEPETISLEALVVRPNDTLRRPLVIINHGSPRDQDERDEMSSESMRPQAEEFARRGWVAVAVMRRGYGSSGGKFSEGYGGCQHPDYVSAGREGANDIRETIRIMRTKPYVDSSKVISIGRSAGGYATVALTADPPPGLVAAINFAGGRGSVRVNFVCEEQRLVEAFGIFGKTSRTPMLWVYSENDNYFDPRLAKEMHEAFSAAGGRAYFITAPAFGADGHKLFSKAGIPVWTPYVFDFLDKIVAVK